MHIGILEDNPLIGEYLSAALDLAGHSSQVFSDGASLLATLFPASGLPLPLPYDLITIDLLLPGEVSGLDVLTHIRERLPAERLPIIIVSGASQQDIEQAAQRFPQVAILRKPVKLKALLELIARLTP